MVMGRVIRKIYPINHLIKEKVHCDNQLRKKLWRKDVAGPIL